MNLSRTIWGMTKPRLVIASSSEQIKTVDALTQLLHWDFEITPWQTIFNPSNTPLDDILKAFRDQDYGVVILGPDDQTLSRGKNQPSPRDNATFELGILVGLLGRERAFWVIDKSNPVKIPSDLSGITPVVYDSQRSDGNLKAALSVASSAIKEAAERLGNRAQPDLNNGATQTVTKDRVYNFFSTHIEMSKSQHNGYLDATYSLKRELTAITPILYWLWNLSRRVESDIPFNFFTPPELKTINCYRSGNGECLVQHFHNVTTHLTFFIDFEPALRPNETFSIETQVGITGFRPATLSGLRERPTNKIPTVGESDFVSLDITNPIERLNYSVTIPDDLGTRHHHLEVTRNQSYDQTETDYINGRNLFTVTHVALPESSWTMHLERENPPLGSKYRLCWTPPT